MFIDASIIKAHRAATGAKWGELALNTGRSRGGRTSKVHAVADKKGKLVQVVITGGQVHDSQVIPALLEIGLNDPLAIVADKAGASKDIRRRIADDGALAVIPSKSNARQPIPHDENLYAMRYRRAVFCAK